MSRRVCKCGKVLAVAKKGEKTLPATEPCRDSPKLFFYKYPETRYV